MRSVIVIAMLALFVQSSSAQALWRNYWTTNQNPQITPSLLATNAASSNNVLTATSAGSAAWKNITNEPSRSIVGSSTQLAVAIDTTARWISLVSWATATASTSESSASQYVPSTCYLTNFYVKYVGTIGSGTNLTATIFTNGTPSNLAVSVLGTGATPTANSNLTDSVPLVAGDTVSIRLQGDNASISGGLRVNLTIEVVR